MMNFALQPKKVLRTCNGFATNEDIDMEESVELQNSELQSDLWREEGCLLAEAGKFQEALTIWQNAIGIAPADHRLHELKAQGYLAMDLVEQALQEAELAVALAPDWVDGLQCLARCQREIGEVTISLQSYKSAHALSPEDEEIKAEMAEVAVLVEQLEVRRQAHLEKMKASTTEGEAEVARCMYHLSARAPPRCQHGQQSSGQTEK